MMKKIFTLMAMGLMAVGTMAQSYETRVLTFEDQDYVSDEENYLHQYNWSSLIDSPQYGGTLLYGENHGDTAAAYTSTNYKWYDKGNTYLYSELPENWGVTMYWGGGHAISNYWNANITEGDYTNQLSVYVPNSSGSGQNGHGHNGSDNFAVHFGYSDGTPWNGTQNLPFFRFGDGTARTIDHMYVNSTTYLANCMTNGNGLTSELAAGDYVLIRATGYDEDDEVTDNVVFLLAKDSGQVVTNWTKWDMHSLGDVLKVEFNMEGSSDNGYGFSQPAYFAYDDVAVRFPIDGTVSSKPSLVPFKSETESENKTMTVTSYYKKINKVKTWWVEFTGEVPEGVTGSFEKTKLNSSGVAPDETTKIEIVGMPDNASIVSVSANVSAYDAGGIGRISAKIGDTEFAQLQFHGGYITEDEWNEGVEVGSEATSVPLSMIEGVDTHCTDNISFTAHSPVTGKAKYDVGVHVYYYDITYTYDVSTGISEFNTLTQNNTLYTLQGMRVTAPQKGQVYVKQGKKIVY